jgi:hypothetical protein
MRVDVDRLNGECRRRRGGRLCHSTPRPTLFEKSGAEGSYRRFKFEMLVIIRRNDLPGLDLALEVAGKEPSLR